MYSRLPFRGRSAALLMLVLAVACGGDSTSPVNTEPSNPATETFAASLGVNIGAMERKSADLYTLELVRGSGAIEAANGRLLRVVYTGWLANGTQFDSNVGRPTFALTLGAREVIAGWDQGLVGMRAGGKRRLVIGSTLAYGAPGRTGIPPHSTLVFDVEVVSVQ